jgi:hypothetical protein
MGRRRRCRKSCALSLCFTAAAAGATTGGRFVAAMNPPGKGSKTPKLDPPLAMRPISEQCHICHDVVLTFREMFPCPGAEDPTTMSFDPIHARADDYTEKFSMSCAFVGNCDVFPQQLQQRCYAMRNSIEVDPKRRQEITAAVMAVRRAAGIWVDWRVESLARMRVVVAWVISLGAVRESSQRCCTRRRVGETVVSLRGTFQEALGFWVEWRGRGGSGGWGGGCFHASLAKLL